MGYAFQAAHGAAQRLGSPGAKLRVPWSCSAADPHDVWLPQRNHYDGHLKLTQDPNEYTARVKEQLQERLKQFVDPVVVLESKPAGPEDLRVSELRRALYAGPSLGQISEMKLQLDRKLRFSWLLIRRAPYNPGELLLVHAAVLNLGRAMSAAEVLAWCRVSARTRCVK